MKEYIEKAAVEKFIEDGLNNPDKNKAFGHDAIEIMAEIHYMPAADVAPVVHARWELSQRIAGGARWECSLCGREIETNMLKKLHRFPYCHCGAKMDMNKEGE